MSFDTKPARFSVSGIEYSSQHGCYIARISPAYGEHVIAFLRKEDRRPGVRGPILRKAELIDAMKFVFGSCPDTSAKIADKIRREAIAGRLVDPDRPVPVDPWPTTLVEPVVEPEPEPVVEPEPVDDDGPLVHKAFSTVLTILMERLLPYLVGPAGTGKTTLGRMLADKLGVDCHVISMHEMMTFEDLVGFVSPTTGEPVRSADAEAVRRFFGEGGLLVIDEMDNGNANTLAGANNLALADEFHFAGDDEPTQRHPDFFILAAANTFGTGPTAEYVGRNQLDAATLNRFCQVEVDYDQRVERRLAGEFLSGRQLDTFLRFCWQARIQLDGERVIFGTRNIVEGAQLLAAGLTWEQVLNIRLLPGVSPDVIRKSGLSVAPSGF